MAYLPLLLLPLVGWLVHGASWYLAANAVFLYGYGYFMWVRWLRRRAVSGV